jgi:hypothetical protein
VPAPCPTCAAGYKFDGYYCAPVGQWQDAPPANDSEDEARAFTKRLARRMEGKVGLRTCQIRSIGATSPAIGRRTGRAIERCAEARHAGRAHNKQHNAEAGCSPWRRHPLGRHVQ